MRRNRLGSVRIFSRLSETIPFAIFYTVSRDTVFVHAVVDCRRKPAWIAKHLK
jgi:hypothetical protein